MEREFLYSQDLSNSKTFQRALYVTEPFLYSQDLSNSKTQAKFWTVSNYVFVLSRFK